MKYYEEEGLRVAAPPLMDGTVEAEYAQGGLESGGKDNTKQTNELLLRAL